MMSLACDVVSALQGRTLSTAESLTGGGIGAAITAVPGSSKVYMGGIVSYVDAVKEHILGVPAQLLSLEGAVSESVAEAMAKGVREKFGSDFSISVTGLAGPSGDSFGHSVGTVFIGCGMQDGIVVREYHFSGTRQQIRTQTCEKALALLLSYL